MKNETTCLRGPPPPPRSETDFRSHGWRLMYRNVLWMKGCDLDFHLCDVKCSDCVGCRRGHDRAMCKEYRMEYADLVEGRNEEDEKVFCLAEYNGCQDVCPRRNLYPRCTACCDCLTYADRAWQWKNRPPELGRMFDFIPLEDDETIYTNFEPGEEQLQGWFHRNGVLMYAGFALVIICGGTAVVGMRGGFNDVGRKLGRLALRSTASGKVYTADTEAAIDDLGPARTFRPDVKQVPPNLKIKKEAKPDESWKREPAALPRQVPRNYIDMMAEDRRDRMGGNPIEPLEAKAGRPICIEFLEGHCTRGSTCRFNHEHNALLPGASLHAPTVGIPGTRPGLLADKTGSDLKLGSLNSLGEPKGVTDISRLSYNPARPGHAKKQRNF